MFACRHRVDRADRTGGGRCPSPCARRLDGASPRRLCHLHRRCLTSGGERLAPRAGEVRVVLSEWNAVLAAIVDHALLLTSFSVVAPESGEPGGSRRGDADTFQVSPVRSFTMVTDAPVSRETQRAAESALERLRYEPVPRAVCTVKGPCVRFLREALDMTPSLDRGAAHGLFASGPADYSNQSLTPGRRVVGDGPPRTRPRRTRCSRPGRSRSRSRRT